MQSVRVSEKEYQVLFDTVIFLQEQGLTEQAEVLDVLAQKIHMALIKKKERSNSGLLPRSLDSANDGEAVDGEKAVVDPSPLGFIGQVLAVKSLLNEFHAPGAKDVSLA